MEFIASFWFLWLVIMILGWGYAIANQLMRMKRITSEKIPVDPKTDFMIGVGSMMVAGAIGSLGGFLLLLSVILNAVEFVK